VNALELAGVGVGLSLVPATVVVALKGRWTLVIAGLCLLFPLLWYGAFAPANPTSWWARRFYGEKRMRDAEHYQARWSRTFAE